MTFRKIVDPVQNFWSYVEKTDNHWIWRGCIRKDGYGQLRWRGKIRAAHRVAYELVKGNIPLHYELHHEESCPKNCVNPEHLTPYRTVDHPDRQSVINSKKTHCPQGHEYNYVDSRGSRMCLTCISNRKKYGNPNGPTQATLQN